MSPNLRAFLSMIAWSEIGPVLLASSDNGYNVIVGGGTFTSYHDHPRQIVRINPRLSSSAAGRYQLLMRYWDSYKQSLHLPDFGPESQDAVAIQQIKECKALPLIEAGNFDAAVEKVAHIWASLPGANYGQHEQQLATLRTAYTTAGGIVA